MQIGQQIQRLRKQQGLTQAAFAQRLFVTPQAVSQWERGVTVPDTEKLSDIASALNTTVNALTGDGASNSWVFADALFSPERMYSRLVSFAQIEKLPQTYAALPYMKEKHQGQVRKPAFYSRQPVPYIIHPLMMACHAHALGIREDEILAAILLHDICEDCGVAPEQLPFCEPVKAAVARLTFRQGAAESAAEAKRRYYEAIAADRIATMVKVLDRCNNISTMAGAFSQGNIIEYIDETETYVLPLLEKAKYSVPEYADALFVIKYHMRSVLESIKAMAARQ